ncbi:MAG: HRDC domain-containing protein, partial [Planctomycetes bacterium]|nr:HRDC domain-containing protein [Planctomycetota bacterium]
SYWRRVIAAAVTKGLAEIRDPRYPTPSVTEAGWEVMRGNGTFEILKMIDRPAAAGRRGGTAGRFRSGDSGQAGESTAPVPEELFARLRKERSRLAEEASVPPYVIFSDRSLRDMARMRPKTDEEFLAVHGVGQHKLKKYGAPFLAIIAEFSD